MEGSLFSSFYIETTFLKYAIDFLIIFSLKTNVKDKFLCEVKPIAIQFSETNFFFFLSQKCDIDQLTVFSRYFSSSMTGSRFVFSIKIRHDYVLPCGKQFVGGCSDIDFPRYKS